MSNESERKELAEADAPESRGGWLERMVAGDKLRLLGADVRKLADELLSTRGELERVRQLEAQGREQREQLSRTATLVAQHLRASQEDVVELTTASRRSAEAAAERARELVERTGERDSARAALQTTRAESTAKEALRAEATREVQRLNQALKVALSKARESEEAQRNARLREEHLEQELATLLTERELDPRDTRIADLESLVEVLRQALDRSHP